MNNNIEDIWWEIDQLLRQQLETEDYDSWFSNLRLISMEGNQAVVHVPSIYRLDWLERHYRRYLEDVIQSVTGEKIRLNLKVEELEEEMPEQPPSPASYVSGGSDKRGVGLPLNPKYRFENFVVGDGNRMTHAYARAVAENPPGEVYNPLYLHGGVGMGKTHVMQAIGHAIIESKRGLRVAYMDAESFVNEFIESIQKKTRNEFQEKYRNNVDVLLVDDIHFLAGKDATQEEFFHTFNSLYNGRKQIVISSDCPPKDLALITDRLRSRFAGGLIAEIQAPDVETREAILWQKCEQEKIKLPVEVIRLISQRVQSSIRELEGALVKLAAHARYTGKRITLEMAQEILRDVVQDDPRGISIEKIQKHVAEHFRVKTSDILGSKRNRSIAVPRRVAMYLSRELTNHSFPEIGVFFGNKDHSTVIHACKKVEEEMRESEDFAKFMERLKQEVRGMGS
ncbi:MAG: chromosomal replication initiator protein DnaA [Candidatus Omnitrophica bacterium]|nr:chromosomal replication initiator protein DnaA [Candidatus Omnitrophota bacterium]